MWNHKLHTLRRQRLFESDEEAGGHRTPEVHAARDLAAALIVSGSAFERWSELASLLEPYGGTEWNIAPDKLTRVLPPDLSLPALPPSYGFKGGAARHLLRSALGRPAELPRDLDLVRIGTRWNATDTELSGRYMGDDFRRGHGVELVRDLSRYLRTRDISLNELLYIDGTLTVTPIALLDTLGLVLRPCRYLPGTLSKPPALLGRILLKMLRLRAEGLARGESWTLLGIPERVDIEEFHVALQLHRAAERSEEVARLFADSLVYLGLLTIPSEGDPLAVCRELLDHHLELLQGDRPDLSE